MSCFQKLELLLLRYKAANALRRDGVPDQAVSDCFATFRFDYP